jgi:hypothetical protein
MYDKQIIGITTKRPAPQEVALKIASKVSDFL